MKEKIGMELDVRKLGRDLVYRLFDLDLPNVEEASRQELKGNLGWADYRTGKIKIARDMPEGLKQYVLGHEVLELLYQPQTEGEHAELEARYLEATEGLWGIIYHGLGLKYGSEFSRRVSKYLKWLPEAFEDVKRKYRQAVEMVEKYLVGGEACWA